MQRIHALDVSAAPAASAAMLEPVGKKLGMVPNLFKTLAHSPAVLKFYLQQGETLAGGTLPAPLREQLALVTAGANGCDYCASAHTLMGKGAGLAPAEMAANLRGRAADARTQAALDFARAIVDERGHVTDAQLEAERAAGFGDVEILEIVAAVVANIFTNYVNNIARTVVDFPLVRTSDVRSAA